MKVFTLDMGLSQPWLFCCCIHRSEHSSGRTWPLKVHWQNFLASLRGAKASHRISCRGYQAPSQMYPRMATKAVCVEPLNLDVLGCTGGALLSFGLRMPFLLSAGPPLAARGGTSPRAEEGGEEGKAVWFFPCQCLCARQCQEVWKCYWPLCVSELLGFRKDRGALLPGRHSKVKGDSICFNKGAAPHKASLLQGRGWERHSSQLRQGDWANSTPPERLTIIESPLQYWRHNL